VSNPLHLSIGFNSFHLRWVPHLLTDEVRQKRKDDARAILRLLHAAQRDRWHDLVTGHESWFFFDISPRQMWILSRDDVATKPRQQIQSKKFMFTIRWNSTAFYVVDRLPNDTKMNSAHFVTNIFAPLDKAIFPQQKEAASKKTYYSSRQLHSSHESGLNRVARRT
jgi:hypothetical protein